MSTRTDRVVRWIQLSLVVIGVTCLVWVATSSLSAIVYQTEQGVWLARLASSLDREKAERAADAVGTAMGPSAPIGRLDIPRIGLSVVVAEGDDETTLRIAAGHLPDTPFPWEQGNSAVAGHRDSFFRPLRHVQVGDEIQFTTPHGTFRYRVTRHTVVEPNELWVLNASPIAALTLITCYPFDFVGSAPRRFVVHAERLADADGGLQTRTAAGGGKLPDPSSRRQAH